MEHARIRYSASAIETLDDMVDKFERLLGRRAEEIAAREDRRVVNHEDITRAWEIMFERETQPVAPGTPTDDFTRKDRTPVYEDAIV